MNVAEILQEKGRDVFTLTADVTLGEVAKVLAEKRVGALVLLDDTEAVIGIVSERDVVRKIGTLGPPCLDQSVQEAMTMKVKTCRESTNVDEAMSIMSEGRFRHLPVVENDRLVGLVSIGDIVKQKIATVEQEAEQLREYIGAA